MSPSHQAKAKRWFVALAELGPEIPRDYGKRLRDGVWELRIVIEHHQHRFLYSFWKDIVLVTGAFLKKSRAVPDDQIEKSRKALADWVGRGCWEEL
jgi:phage-related protein